MINKQHTNPLLPILALLFGATTWGLAWYPYRLLEQEGINGDSATILTYLIALLLGLILFHKHLQPSKIFNGKAHLLFWIGFCSGWANIAYIFGILLGDVMRVLLLFYLAPLWTVIFSRLLLNEKLSTPGFFVIALSLAGAATMLWQPSSSFILPTSYSDWLGIFGGFMFALMNVLIRKDQTHHIHVKSIAIWLGVSLVGIGCSLVLNTPITLTSYSVFSWQLLLVVGIMMFIMTIVLQYGLTHVPANQAIVILLFEIFVAAISAHLLTDETMTTIEWIGGAMIVSASLFSASLGTDRPSKEM